MFVQLAILGRFFPVPGEGVRDLEGAGVIAPHPGKGRRVVNGRFARGGLREQLGGRQQTRAGADGNAVQEIPSCNLVFHRIKTPLAERHSSAEIPL